MITTDPKNKPGTPQHSPGHEEHEAATGQAGPAPRAAATGSPVLTHASFAPGPICFEFTNTAAFALTVGANTMTVNLPQAGAGYWSQYLTVPLLAAVYPATGTITSDPTLPVPQSPTKLTNQTALPASVGIRNVTLQPTATPPTLTVNVIAQAAGTVPLGSRWMIYSVQGL